MNCSAWPPPQNSDLVIGPAGERVRHCGIRGGERSQRDRRRHRRRVEAEAQRALAVEADADPGCREEAAQHERGGAGAEHQQPGDEERAVEHGNVVGHDRLGMRDERRERHQRGADRAERERGPAPGSGPRRAVQAPQQPGKGDEPDEHREIDVDDERDAEELGDVEAAIQPRGSRQHQQDREQAGADQGQQAEPEPAARERGLRTARHREPVRGGPRRRRRPRTCAENRCRSVHCQTMPPFSASKSITRTCAGASLTVAARS